jgi:hypothetical protein
MSLDATIRDLVSRTLPAPLPAEFDRAVENQSELPPPIRARSGTARITANDGGGAYKITETTGGAGGLAVMTAPAGFVARVAYAIDDADSWEVDDDVFYMQVPTDAGQFTTYIERGLVTGDVVDTYYIGNSPGCGIRNLRIQGGLVTAFEKDVSDIGPPYYRWYDGKTGELIP